MTNQVLRKLWKSPVWLWNTEWSELDIVGQGWEIRVITASESSRKTTGPESVLVALFEPCGSPHISVRNLMILG